MAGSQSKSSVHRAQPAHPLVNTATTTDGPKSNRAPLVMKRRRQVVQFPEVKGKVLEGAELVSSSDFHAISFCFKDKTALDLVIDPCFTVHADYLDRKTGEGRVLKAWPLMHAVRFRTR